VLYIRIIDPNKNTELWVSDIDGRNQLKLASAVNIGTGFWSADASRVIFFATESNAAVRAYIIGIDGRGLTPIELADQNIQNVSWSIDGKHLFVTTVEGRKNVIWRTDSDGKKPEKFLENCYAMEATPDGKYLLGVILSGKDTGIYQISLDTKKRTLLIPDVETFLVRMSQDRNAFLYTVAGRGEILFYRQEWKDGKLLGEPKLALQLPFAFPLSFFGNAYDFSPDLSTIVYAKPGGQADLYYMTYSVSSNGS